MDRQSLDDQAGLPEPGGLGPDSAIWAEVELSSQYPPVSVAKTPAPISYPMSGLRKFPRRPLREMIF